jgi:hypothetical protein
VKGGTRYYSSLAALHLSLYHFDAALQLALHQIVHREVSAIESQWLEQHLQVLAMKPATSIKVAASADCCKLFHTVADFLSKYFTESHSDIKIKSPISYEHFTTLQQVAVDTDWYVPLTLPSDHALQ